MSLLIPTTIERGAATETACDLLIASAGSAERLVMPHRTHPIFMDAMKRCAKFAKALKGSSISGLGSDYFSASAGFSTHCDNDHVQALPGTFMSVWLALADVTERNGPLVIGGKLLLCSKGDAILIDGDTPHRSCAGLPGEKRPVALFTYIKTGCPFRPGDTQQRAEVTL